MKVCNADGSTFQFEGVSFDNLFSGVAACAPIPGGSLVVSFDERETERLKALLRPKPIPVSMLLWCPACGERHVDEDEWASKPHHTHACQACGHVWRPAVVETYGVQFLPGFKNT